MEPQILAGEAPDPTRIPPGCRFHPRCPVLASGESARLGIEDLCRGQDLALLAPAPGSPAGHLAACHAVRRSPKRLLQVARDNALEAAFHVAGGHVHGDVVGVGIGAEIELASAVTSASGHRTRKRAVARARSCWVDGRDADGSLVVLLDVRRARRRTRSRGR